VALPTITTMTRRPSDVRARILASLGATLLLAQLLVPVEPVAADDNPATAAMSHSCELQRPVTEGLQLGIPGVSVGETVTVVSRANFGEGTVYQDMIQRPNGSSVVASYLELTVANSAGVGFDSSTVGVSVDGSPAPTSIGTLPAADSWVIHEVTPRKFRAYLPAAVDPSDPTQGAVASLTVPSTGMSVTLEADVLVEEMLSNTAGTVLSLGTCAISVSTGSSNRIQPGDPVNVAVVEPSLSLTKDAAAETVSPGATVDWTVSVRSPEMADASLTNGPASDLVVTDTLPVGLSPTDLAGNALGDGAAVPATTPGAPAGTFELASRRIRWDVAGLSAGDLLVIGYRTVVDPGLDPLDATALTNSATATWSSVPAAHGDGRSYDAGPVADTVIAGVPSPVITKSADRTNIWSGTPVTWTVEFTIPANASAPLHEVTLIDALHDGVDFNSEPVLSCVDCAPGDPTSFAEVTPLDPVESSDGTQTAGLFFGTLQPHNLDRHYTFTLGTVGDPGRTYADGSPFTVGDVIENTASVGYNLVPRLGSVTPNLQRPPAFDAFATAGAAVTLAKPELSITKSIDQPSPIDPNDRFVSYTITVRNDGDVDAYDVRVRDEWDTQALYANWWGNLPPEVNSEGWNPVTFTVDHVPANDEYSFTYEMSLAQLEASGDPLVTKSIDNTATLVGLSDGSGNPYPAAELENTPSASATFRQSLPDLDVRIEATDGVSPANEVATGGDSVTFLVTMTNNGDGAARTNQVDVTLPDGWDAESSATNGYSHNGSPPNISFGNGGQLLEPGESTSFEFVGIPPKSVGDDPTDIVAVSVDYQTRSWRSSYNDTATGGQIDFNSTDDETITLIEPVLEVAKTPDTGAIVEQNGTFTWTVRITNPTSLPVHNIVVTETMAETMSYDSASPTVSPADATVSMTEFPDLNHPRFEFSHLAPGASIILSVNTVQSGIPEEFELVNSVAVSADGTSDVFTDTGTATFTPNIVRPWASKSADPGSGRPGEEVEFTLGLTLPTNALDLYSAAFVDEVPDGIEFIDYGTITCTSGPCTQTPAPMTAAEQPDGAWRIGWYLGDQAAGADDSTWEVTYDARIDRTFSGLGVPADGSIVLDGLGKEPFANRVRGYANLGGPLGAVPDPTPAAPRSVWDIAGPTATAYVDVTTPKVEIEKTVTDHETLTWRDDQNRSHTDHWADAGDEVNYELEVCNTGSADAHDVVFSDTGGEGNLIGVVVDPLPAGAHMSDPWSEADPEMTFQVGVLAASECVTISYSGTTLPPAELVPGFPGTRTSAVGVIDNTVTIDEYHTIGDGEPNDETYTPDDELNTRTLVVTPIPHTGVECVIGSQDDRVTINASAYNGNAADLSLGPNYMNTPEGAAPLVDPTWELVLPDGVIFVPGSVKATGPYTGSDEGVFEAFPDPQLSNGGSILTWDLDDLPMSSYTNLSVTFEVDISTDGTVAPIAATLQGNDSTGAPGRGSSSGQAFTYRATGGSCPGDSGPWIEKSPDANSGSDFIHRPGEDANWYAYWSAGSTLDEFDVEPFVAAGSTITDTMPDGVTYTPGRATFSVTRRDGSTEALTAGVEVTEAVVANGDGTETITWGGFGEHLGGSVTIPVAIDTGRPDLVDTTVTNRIAVDLAGRTVDTCGSGHDICDTGVIRIVDPAELLVTTAVDDPGPAAWGETRRWTVEVVVPPEESYEEAVVVGTFPSGGIFDSVVLSHVSATCTEGCENAPDPSHITPVALPESDGEFGWYLGDLAQHTEARTLKLVYDTVTPDGDVLAGMGGLSADTTEIPWSNQAVFHSALASPVPPPPGLPQGENQINNWRHSYCASVGGCLALGTASATTVLGHPWLETSYVCQSVNPSGQTISTFPLVSITEPGVPNVVCRIEVTNTGTSTAYGIDITDTPDPSTGTWAVLATVGSEFPPTTSFAASGNQFVRWAADPFDPLGPGEKWVFRTVNRVSPGAPDHEFYTGLYRTASLAGYSAVPGAVAQPFDGSSIDTPMFSMRPFNWSWTAPWSNRIEQSYDAEPGVTSVDYAMGIFNEIIYYAEDGGLAGGDPFETMLRFPIDQDDLTLSIDTLNLGIDGARTLNLSDQLPAGWRYTPGTARLAVVDDPDGQLDSGDESINTIPIDDPAVSATAWPGCDPAGGLGDDYNAGGDTVNWAFSYDSPPPMNAPWVPAAQMLNLDVLNAYDFTGDGLPFTGIKVLFDVTRDEAAQACDDPPQGLALWYFDHHSSIVEKDGATGSFHFDWALATLDLIALDKRPDGGLVPDSATGSFDIDVSNYFPQLDDDDTIDDWSFDSPNGAVPATIVDTFEDRGLVEPATFDAELRLIAPDGVGTDTRQLVEGVDYTETAVRLDPDTIEVTWEVASVPSGGGTQPSEANPLGLDPAHLRIHVPFEIPVDTPDGTTYANSATVDAGPLRLDDQDNQGLAANEFLFHDTDDADLTVINPSPPPTPTKSGPASAAVGELVEYSVGFDLPANQVWLDLYAHDQLPEGLELDSVRSITCTTAGGNRCWDLPEVTADTASDEVTVWFGDFQGAPEGRTVTVTYSARVATEGTGLSRGDTITNNVHAYSNDVNRFGNGPDDLLDGAPGGAPDHGPRSASSALTLAAPRVRLDKVALTPGPLNAGSTATWQLTVTNDGDATAFDLDIEDRPSAAATDLRVDSSTGPIVTAKGWSASDSTLRWYVGELEPGETATVTYSGTVVNDYDDLGVATLDNNARVFPYGSAPESNEFRAVMPVVRADASIALRAPRLVLDKVAGACGSGANDQLVFRDEPSQWCVTLLNDGEITAAAVELVDLLPNGWTFDATSTNPTAAISNPVAGAEQARWTLGDLDPGASAEFTYTATPGSSAGRIGVNRASATSELADGSRAKVSVTGYSDSDTATARVARAGLEVQKTTPTFAVPIAVTGGSVPWRIRVLNNGEQPLPNSIVTDTLPAPLSYTAGTAVSDCDGFSENSVNDLGADTEIIWSLDMAPGADCVIDLVTSHPGGLPSGGLVINDAGISNWRSSEVAEQAGMRAYSPAMIGDRVWRDANGNGIQDSGEPGIGGITVAVTGTDDWDDPVTLSTTTDASGVWSLTVPPGTYTVTFGDPPEGLVFTIPDATDDTTDSDADPVTGTTATIRVESGATDNSIDAGMAEPSTNLLITKSADDSTPAVGDPVAWTIRATNEGPGLALGPIEVTDVLPEGLDYESHSSGDLECALKAMVLACASDEDLPAGATLEVKVSTRVARISELSNLATVRTNSVETTLEDNSAVATITVEGTELDPIAGPPEAPPSAGSSGDPATPADTPSPGGPSTPRGAPAPLAFTGTNVLTLLLLAFGFIVGGLMIALIRRRRGPAAPCQ
jgi:uncharacterized repeat protein (TIGR01451 family)/fimbrial isopeptide formation D2 family protein